MLEGGVNTLEKILETGVDAEDLNVGRWSERSGILKIWKTEDWSGRWIFELLDAGLDS